MMDLYITMIYYIKEWDEKQHNGFLENYKIENIHYLPKIIIRGAYTVYGTSITGNITDMATVDMVRIIKPMIDWKSLNCMAISMKEYSFSI